MIIFLYGQDTYRSKQKIGEIVGQYKKIHKSGLNLRFFDGDNLKYQNFIDEISLVSMFDEKKLIILRNVVSNKEFQENFLKNKKKFADSDNIILFYEEDLPEKENKFFESLKKIGKTQEFPLLGAVKLKNWAQKEFNNHGIKIEDAVLGRLVDFVGDDLWQMSNEIQKLAAFKKKEKKIVKEDIDLLVRPKIETDIFKTIDALADKNKSLALELIHEHLRKGQTPLYLLSMINFQFRNLLLVKSNESEYKFNASYPSPQLLSARLGMNPYVIRKSTQQARKFSLSELKKIYQKIFEVDLGVKTGKIEPELGLDLLISQT